MPESVLLQDVLLVLLGAGLGLFGTLIGAGGGFLLVPVLLLIYPETSPDKITAVSLAMVCCNAASGAFSYGRMGRVDFKSGLLFLATGLPGAVLGAWLIRYVPRHAFDWLFSLLLVGAGLFLFFRPLAAPAASHSVGTRFRRVLIEADGQRHEYAFSLPLGLALSFGVGVLSSLLGIGGGIIHVPAMVHVLGFPVHVATATSHFILAGMTLTGTVVHVFDGTLQANLTLAVCLALGAVVGAQFGARLSRRIHGRWIMRLLSLALVLVGVRLLIFAAWK